MNLSNRILNMDYSPIRKLSSIADKAKSQGIEVLHLNIGQPDIETPLEFREKLKTVSEKTLKYTDSRGTDDVIKSFQTYYSKIGIHVEKEDMIVTNGGSEALLFTMMSICDVGDEIITPAPYYSNYNNFADMAGVKVVPLERNIEDDYTLPDISNIEDIITEKTKAILISNPCNPTGAIYDNNDLNTLLDIAVKHNLYIISDEVYREFVYDKRTPISILNLDRDTDKIVIIDSVSKRYSACGCRIGVMLSKNRELMNNALKLGQSRLCIPTIEQVMASAIKDVPQSYLDNALAKYESRRNTLIAGLNSINGVVCSNPKGAFYIMAKLPVEDSEHFSKWLLSEFSHNNKTVMMAPASSFYGSLNKGIDEVRLSYVIEEDKLNEAVEILSLGIKKYQEENIYKKRFHSTRLTITKRERAKEVSVLM